MKTFNLFLLFVLATSTFSFAQNKSAILKTGSTITIDDGAYSVDPYPLIEKFNRANGIDMAKLAGMPLPLKKVSSWGFTIGSKKSWWASNFVNNSFYSVPSTCRAVGVNCYVFAEDSIWTNGRVNQTVVDSIRLAFDSRTPANAHKGIFQTNVDTFGNPSDVDNDPKIVILILNIIDGYDGVTSKGYIGGYFHSINEYSTANSNVAEIYYLDCNPANLTSIPGLTQGMTTTAHEFQHMINFRYNQDQMTFLNESLSMCAEVVNGYALRDQSLFNLETNHYLFDWRTGDSVLTDYSRAARFSTYLWEQFSTPVLKSLVQSTLSGLSDISYALANITQTPPVRNFTDVLEDWFIANCMNDRGVNLRWGYLNAGAGRGVAREHANPNVTNYNDKVSKYGAQYVTFNSGSNLKINFNVFGNAFIKIKAIKSGNSGKVVESVVPGVNYTVPDFGSTYNQVTFVVYITDSNVNNAAYNYSYTSTGTVAPIPTDILYTSTFITYTFGSTSTDYVAGTNSLKNRALYERFDIQGTASVKEIRYYFSKKAIAGTADNVAFAIRSANLDGSPGKILYSSASTTQSFVLPVGSTVQPTPIVLPVTPAVNVTNSFFVGLEWDPTKDDAFSLYTNDASLSQGGGKKRAWWQNNDYTFTSIGDAFVGGFDADLAIGVKLNVTTDVDQITVPIPSSFELSQNYPNPFNPSTYISFQIPAVSYVEIKVFDILGCVVADLVNEEKAAGYHKINWNGINNSGCNVSSGIYFYSIKAGSFVETKKMVLLK